MRVMVCARWYELPAGVELKRRLGSGVRKAEGLKRAEAPQHLPTEHVGPEQTSVVHAGRESAAPSAWAAPKARLKMAAVSGVESVVYAAIGFAGLWAGTWLTLVTNVPPAVFAVVPIIEWIWALTWLALSAIQMGALFWRLAVSSIKEG